MVSDLEGFDTNSVSITNFGKLANGQVKANIAVTVDGGISQSVSIGKLLECNKGALQRFSIVESVGNELDLCVAEGLCI